MTTLSLDLSRLGTAADLSDFYSGLSDAELAALAAAGEPAGSDRARRELDRREIEAVPSSLAAELLRATTVAPLQ